MKYKNSPTVKTYKQVYRKPKFKRFQHTQFEFKLIVKKIKDALLIKKKAIAILEK